MVEVLETQIDFILRQADEAVPAVKASREAGVSDTTFCKWR